MADLSQLHAALVNADAAGDTEAARALAGEISRMRQSGGSDFASRFDAVSDEAAFRAVKPAQKPFGLGDTWPAKIAKGLYSAMTLPGDVAQGNVSMTDANGNTNPEVINRSAELASVASPMSPAARMGVGWAGALKTQEAPAPTQEALAKAASVGYDKARGLGVEIAPQAIANLGHKIGATLDEMGINGELAPKTFSILDRISNPPPGAVGSTISNLETIRRSLGHAAKDFANPTEQLAAGRAKDHLLDYMATIPDQDVIRGPAAEASKILRDATGNYAASKRAGQITDAYDAADLSAAAANSGQNAGNATRQRIKSILLNDKKSAGYSPDEVAQMETLVRGTTLGNTGRVLGNYLGGGGGLGALHSSSAGAGVGALLGGPLGAAVGAALPPTVGYGLKKLSDKSVNTQAQALVDMILKRSPLAQSGPATVAAQAPGISQQALARLLLGSPMGQQ
jgi:hypothetical protein